MTILRSQRLFLESGGFNGEPFLYDPIPDEFRNQLKYYLIEMFGKYGFSYGGQEFKGNTHWNHISITLRKEYGKESLVSEHFSNSRDEILIFCKVSETIRLLDLIEYLANYVSYQYFRFNVKKDYFNFEINKRFNQHNLGYELIDGKLVRKDNTVTHEIIVKEALKLLHYNNFSGPSDEFMSALKEYKDGSYKNSINESLKAFESTMKCICSLKKYKYSKNYTSKKLIEVLFKNEFIPNILKSHYSGIITTLSSGLPTIRNKVSSHGQGPEVEKVEKEYAQYALNLCATNIVFLVESAVK